MARSRKPPGGPGGKPKQTRRARPQPPAKKKRAARPTKKKRTARKWPLAGFGFPAREWPAALLRGALILLVLFVAAITTWTFSEAISVVEGLRSWSTAPVYFFGMGMAFFVVTRIGLPETLLYLYVFAHELTHVIFVYLCGGKVHGDIRVSVRGGHVVANKSNWLISLSPYFVPFYTVIVALGFVIASPLVDLGKTVSLGWLDVQPLYVLYASIGFTWTMHIYYTLTMLMRDQPDFEVTGIILSLLVIYLVNSIIVISFVAWTTKTLSWRGFVEAWFANAQDWINLVLVRLAALIW